MLFADAVFAGDDALFANADTESELLTGWIIQCKNKDSWAIQAPADEGYSIVCLPCVVEEWVAAGFASDVWSEEMVMTNEWTAAAPESDSWGATVIPTDAWAITQKDGTEASEPCA